MAVGKKIFSVTELSGALKKSLETIYEDVEKTFFWALVFRFKRRNFTL